MAEELGITFDEEEIRIAEEKAREASKSTQANTQTFTALDVHQIAELEDSLKIQRTDSEAKYSKGSIKATVKRAFANSGFQTSTKELPQNSPLGLILDKTNFYAESGGQVGDTGRIIIDGESEFKVVDVQDYGGYVLHNGYIEYGTLSEGDEVICIIDELRRAPIRNNHTGTHVLNHSLREVLGDDVHQQGSLVNDEKLRFDFSHKSGISSAEIQKIEELSNKDIEANLRTYSLNVSLAEARQIEGLRAVFGETYPDPVRVVSIGVPVEELLKDAKNPKWREYSVEFCVSLSSPLYLEVMQRVLTTRDRAVLTWSRRRRLRS